MSNNQKEKRMPNKDGTWPQLEIILPGRFYIIYIV
jgi:hypothetical protein